jgi:hypothetical protein
MVTFLSLMILSLLAVALCAAAFAAATRGEPRPEAPPDRQLVLERPRFFAAPATKPAEPAVLPVEVLVSQIERHVRLEQAAAENYLDLPTRDALHSRTASPLLN